MALFYNQFTLRRHNFPLISHEFLWIRIIGSYIFSLQWPVLIRHNLNIVISYVDDSNTRMLTYWNIAGVYNAGNRLHATWENWYYSWRGMIEVPMWLLLVPCDGARQSRRISLGLLPVRDDGLPDPHPGHPGSAAWRDESHQITPILTNYTPYTGPCSLPAAILNIQLLFDWFGRVYHPASMEKSIWDTHVMHMDKLFVAPPEAQDRRRNMIPFQPQCMHAWWMICFMSYRSKYEKWKFWHHFSDVPTHAWEHVFMIRIPYFTQERGLLKVNELQVLHLTEWQNNRITWLIMTDTCCWH